MPDVSDANPTPTQEIVTDFNELRQDMVLLYELKLALTNCEYELQTLRHRYETLAPGKVNKACANQFYKHTALQSCDFTDR